ncbi:CsbA family protein [Fictibacillus sp. WQ 8-8]|uniref:DUF2198 family protein n=1 Tax=unclassified Fictibacillus TaxID=2644029 RepID=UPI0007862385|nr:MULTISPECIES: DUF2198 family protein [unclassified Fictibacillus]MCQ6264321.1 CsbA family protein [Fictibacillus sp. WQ 8-8]MED2971633.1 DUF2198 family protein [Fictibacillus sp. B-59209]UZJ79769.1 CsbA family protein [Fictibacillus sp. KU28468]SFD43761.1 hypothetical protein SAMN05428981_101401 [Bacillus sp. OV194]
MVEVLLAALLPIVLQLLFNRVLFSKYLPVMITLLILLFAFDGLNQPLYLQATALCSVLAGYWLGLNIHKKQARKMK